MINKAFVTTSKRLIIKFKDNKFYLLVVLSLILPVYLVTNNLRYGSEVDNAELELRMNNPSSALKHLNKALKINPKGSAQLFSTRALLLFEENKYSAAIGDYEKAVALGHKNYNSFFNLGFAYAKTEQLDKSIKAYDKSLETGSEQLSNIYFNKGISYIGLQKYLDAAKSFSLYINDLPDNSDGYYRRATAYFGHGSDKYDLALQDVNKAISLDRTKDISFYKLRAKIRQKMGDTQGAVSDMTSVIDSSSNLTNPYYYLKRSSLFVDLGDYQSGVSDLSKAISLIDNDPKIYSQRSLLFFMIEDYPKAILDINKAISLNSKDPKFYYIRANILIEHENLEDADLTHTRRMKAISDYDLAIKLEPSVSNYYKGRGRANMLIEQYDDSISDFTKAIDLSANDYKLYALRAIVMIASGKIYEGCADLEVAKANGIEMATKTFNQFCNGQASNKTNSSVKNDDSADIYWMSGVKKQKSGDNVGAIKDLSLAIKLNPKHVYALNSRALARRATNDLSGALRDIDEAISVAPQDFLLYFTKGNILLKAENYSKAVESFDKALELNPSHAGSLIFGGIAKRRFGDILDACKYWRKALELGNEDALELINESCS